MTHTSMSGAAAHRRGLAISFLLLGLTGVSAAFALTLDKLALLENPAASLSCNVNSLVGCSSNLNSAQGEIFGFPNSLLGLVFWSAVIAVGVVLLGGASLARWVWLLIVAGATGAFALVIWFIGQSLFVLAVLCPWCMVTWTATIPFFLIVVLHSLRSGIIPAPLSVRRAARSLFAWIPLTTLVCYLIVAILAQWKLDVLGAFFG